MTLLEAAKQALEALQEAQDFKPTSYTEKAITDLRQAIEQAQDAVLAEREACVKIVENEAWQYTSPVWAFEIVNDIRARGNT